MTAESTLPPALPGEQQAIRGRAGRICCYVAGAGAPMLLLHSINAAGSAYEVRPIFERYAASRRVYAPDLPGFGGSERSDRDYSVRLYVDAVHDVVDEMARHRDETPIDALALSLSSEFLARAARERPERFRTLALVTPTGFGAGSEQLRGDPGSTREVPLVYGALRAGPWGRWLYGLLTRPASIRYFLRRTFGSDRVDEGMVDYDIATARQPGAEHAPLAFLSARLFSRDIRAVYEGLQPPVWLAHGTRGDFQDFRGADWARRSPGWTVQPFDTGALPHFERPAEFFAAYDRFLASAGAPDPGVSRA